MTAPTTNTWTVGLDVDRDYGYAYNLTAYIVGQWSFSTGVDIHSQRPIAGQLTFTLENRKASKPHLFTPGSANNISEGLNGLVFNGMPILVTVANSGTYPAWSGFVTDWKPTPDYRQISVSCEGVLAAMGRKKPDDATPVDQATTTIPHAAVAALAGGFPTGTVSNVGGATGRAIVYAIAPQTKTTLQTLADVGRCELATFPVLAEGAGSSPNPPRVHFAEYDEYLYSSPTTWQDGSSITIKDLYAEERYQDRIARVRADFQSFQEATSLTAVFTHPKGSATADSLPIAAGATLYITAPYTDGLAYGAIEPASTTDYTANDAANGSGTDRTSSVTVRKFEDRGNEARILLHNAHSGTVYLTLLKVRAYTVTTEEQSVEFDAPILGLANEGAEIAESFPYTEDFTAITKWAAAMLFTRRQMAPIYHGTVVGSTDENQAAILALLANPHIPPIIAIDDTDAGDLGSRINDIVRIVSREYIVTPAGAGDAPNLMMRFTARPSWLFVNPNGAMADLFDRPNASTLGTSPTGTAWTNAGSGFEIISGKATPKATSDCFAYVDLGSANFVASFGAEELDSDTNEVMGMIVRYADVNNYWFIYWDDSVDEIVLSKQVAGVVTEVAAVSYTARADGTMDGFIVFCGNRVRVCIDGAWIIDQTDSALNTNTKHGFFAQNTTTAVFGRVGMIPA